MAARAPYFVRLCPKVCFQPRPAMTPASLAMLGVALVPMASGRTHSAVSQSDGGSATSSTPMERMPSGAGAARRRASVGSSEKGKLVTLPTTFYDDPPGAPRKSFPHAPSGTHPSLRSDGRSRRGALCRAPKACHAHTGMAWSWTAHCQIAGRTSKPITNGTRFRNGTRAASTPSSTRA